MHGKMPENSIKMFMRGEEHDRRVGVDGRLIQENEASTLRKTSGCII